MVEYTLNYISNCRTVNFPSKQTFHSYPRNQRSGSPCRCSKCRKSLDPSLAVSNNCNQSLSETHRTAGPPLCRIVHLSAQPWQWKHPSCAILPPSPVRPRETCASIDPQLRRQAPACILGQFLPDLGRRPFPVLLQKLDSSNQLQLLNPLRRVLARHHANQPMQPDPPGVAETDTACNMAEETAHRDA